MTPSGFHRPELIPAREAMRHASGQAVVFAIMARLSLDAQQDLIDAMQDRLNRARVAQQKGQ
jgi:hypothetical protein